MSSRARFLGVLAVALAITAVAWLVTQTDAPTTEAQTPAPAAGEPDVRPGVGSPGEAATADESTAPPLIGRVMQSQSIGVEGAVVTLVQHGEPGRPRTTVTQSGGGFELDDVSPGHYAVSATARGYLAVVIPDVEITEDREPLLLNLREGGHRVGGTVEDITGGPVSGALVRAIPVGGVAALREHEGAGTLSDDDGHYELRLTAGRYRLEVSHPDYAPQARTVDVGPTTSAQDFSLVPTGIIEGIVRSETDGNPVPHATVHWSRETSIETPGGPELAQVGGGSVVADVAGKFRIRGIQPGEVELQARAPRLATAHPTRVVVGIAEHLQDVEVWVVGAYDVAGRVVTKSLRDPVPDATVQLLQGAPTMHAASTDAQGRFVLHGVLPGTYGVFASAQGFHRPLVSPTVVVEGDVEDLEVTLPRGAMVIGRVEPPQRAEVSVELRPDDADAGPGAMAAVTRADARTHASDDGHFELGPVAPGRLTIVARTADGLVGEEAFDVPRDGLRDVIIALQERATVAGEVVDPQGLGIEGALVTLRPQRDDGADVRLTVNGRDMGVHTGAAADTGRFEIGGIEEGRHLVSVTDRYGDPLPIRDGTLARKRPILTVRGSSRIEGVTLVVDRHDGVIEGTAVDSDGQPAPDVWVHLQQEPEPEPAPEPGTNRRVSRSVIRSSNMADSNARPPVLTDEAGHFSFTGLREADYELVAQADGGGGRVRAKARPGDDVTLTLQALGTIEGRVTLDGEPVSHYLLTASGPTPRRLQVRDENGRFEVTRLEAGSYELSVKTPDGAGKASITVPAGQTVTKDLPLQGMVDVRGRVVSKDGAPVVGATIMIGTGQQGSVEIRRDGFEPTIVTDDDGRFEARAVPGNRVVVVLSPEQPRPIAVEFFVASPGQSMDLGELVERDEPMGPPQGEPSPSEP